MDNGDINKDARKEEIERLGHELSFETLTKIQIRIQRIRLYFGHFQKIKEFIPKNEHELVYRVYFIAIAALYRSLFKGLDKEIKIDVFNFIDKKDEDLVDNHESLLYITDKDLVHLDKNSKSHRILDVQCLKDGGPTSMVTSGLSEDKLKKTIDFLNEVLEPAIKEAAYIAKEK